METERRRRENLRRKQGQDKGDHTELECGGNIWKAERKKTKKLDIKKKETVKPPKLRQAAVLMKCTSR